jgi:hypothetical protein
MHSQELIRRLLAPLALAGFLAAPAVAQSNGSGQGRWLEVSARTTLLAGFLDDAAGEHVLHIEAVLTTSTPSSGGIYGTLDSLKDSQAGALRKKELFVYGQYSRSRDGSGKFDALIMLQLSGNGLPVVLAVGAVQGALAPAIDSKPITDPVESADLPDDAVISVRPIKYAAFTAPIPQRNEHLARLERARNALRAITKGGVVRIKAIDVGSGMTVQRKGTFRARWAMR